MYELNRRNFIKFLLSSGYFTFNTGLPHEHADKVNAIDEKLSQEHLTIRVNQGNDGQLCVLNYFIEEEESELPNRYDAYEISESELETRESLSNLVQDETVMYLLDVVYDFRYEQDDDEKTKKLGDGDYIMGLSDEKFLELKELVDSHLDGELTEEEDMPYNYSKASLNGYDVAYRMFDDAEGDEAKWAELLGIEMVYGETFMSTYYAAELRKPLDEANEIAKKHNIPITFIR